MFPVNLQTTSGLSNLLHCVISLPDTTSYDKLKNRIGFTFENIKWPLVDLYFLCLKRFLVTLFILSLTLILEAKAAFSAICKSSNVY